MKNPEQMTDEELCEAVAVEVLVDRIKARADEGTIRCPDVIGVYWEHKGQPMYTDILSPDGREAIENELERRGFGMELTISNDLLWPDKDFYASADISAPITEANFEGTVESYMWSCKCKHRALAIAALKAVRGEG